MADPANSPNAASEPAATDNEALTAPSPDQSAGTQAPASSPGDNAASPPDAPVDDRAELLKVVRDVVEAKPKTPPQGEGTTAAPEPASPDPDPNAQPPADPLDTDPTEEELKALHPRSKARIEKLLSQRNGFRTELETLKPDADKWKQMHGYLTQHDLAAEDVNLLLGVGAALRRGDFKAFRDGVAPYLRLADEALGLALPDDLQAKVDAGELSQETAVQFSTTRFSNNRLQQTVQANNEAAEAARQAEAEARVNQAVTQSVTSWEQGVQARDPDYAKKAPMVLRYSQALIAELGRPRTPEDAVALAQRAYAEVNATFAAARPAPVPTRRQPSGAQAVNGTARPEPASMMEAVMRGLEAARGH